MTINADSRVRKPELVCRPAQPADTPTALELCSHIWDGGDYVPRVWKDWLADPLGLLAGCPKPLLPKLLADVRRLGAHLGYQWVGWNAPQHPEVCAALQQAGYHAHWEEGSLFIFERRRE